MSMIVGHVSLFFKTCKPSSSDPLGCVPSSQVTGSKASLGKPSAPPRHTGSFPDRCPHVINCAIKHKGDGYHHVSALSTEPDKAKGPKEAVEPILTLPSPGRGATGFSQK